MKKICTLMLTAGMLLGASSGALAIDFKAKGQFVFGYGAVDTLFDGQNGSDVFAAQQRVRLQLDAIASESLSGTVFFEIGDTTWGKDDGGALGSDGKIVEVKRAYIDWIVPNTELSLRMGIQGVTLPNAAGGPMVFDNDVAGIVASYRFSDMFSLTTAWLRPLNDNFDGIEGRASANFLDNVDLFALMLPISGDGWTITPWAMSGAVGQYSTEDLSGVVGGGGFVAGMLPAWNAGSSIGQLRNTEAYAVPFWAGIPVTYTMDAWNFEFDANYGHTGFLGTDPMTGADIQRSGWIFKALVEYKMAWGTPGIFGWYGTGDDDDVKNGSEMMPYIAPTANFTSFMGDGNELGWAPSTSDSYGYDLMLSYAGTWGIGAHIRNMSFFEDLSHTFRVAYWHGTNSTDMAEHVSYGAFNRESALYLTTTDYLLEFNLDTTYQIYENLQAIVQLGYIVNGIDGDTWNHMNDKRDAYKAALIFNYSF